MGESIERFPLFCLGLVLLPGEVVPLHIFEERYKTMIGTCLDGDTEFGVLWLSDDGLHEVGCSATVAQLLERADDGRLNILAEGTQPFRLERRVDDLPYPAGDVVLLDEISESSDGERGTEARERYADLVERVTDPRPDPSDLSGLNAYGMAATIAFDPPAKQELLELRSEEARLGRLAQLCAQAIERQDQVELAAKRAATNGRVHR